MKQNYLTPPGFTFRLQPFGATTALLLLFFLLNIFIGYGQEPENTTPEYEWIDAENLANFNALDEDETGKTIISIAVDNQGFIYTLSFGNGVDKLNPDGSLNQSQFIPSNQLKSPLDIEVNSEGTIYIVDYFESGSCLDNGKVKVFNSNGAFQEEIAYSYFRPLGLAIDLNDNIYIAEYYDGSTCESGEESRIRVFNKTGDFLKQTYNVEVPYRLAVDSDNTLYVSQAGDDNPQVLFFNESLNFQGSLSNIESPGSIVIDDFNFIHVIEYAGRVDFEKFLNYEEISNFIELISLINGIQQGISNDEFGIKIFNPERQFQYYFQDEAHIEFPVDLTINSSVCASKMYLNNANISSTNLDFDLEIYNRTPTFDTVDPVAICIPSGKEFTLQDGKVILKPEDINDGSYDNCGIDSIELARDEFDTTGPHTVRLNVTDKAGNSTFCETTIEIVEEEQIPPEASCNSFEVTLDGNGQASITAEQVYNGNEDLNLDLDKTNFTCSDLGKNQVILTVTDSQTQLSSTCSAIITVKDEEKPVISNCPTENPEYTIQEGETYILEDYTEQILASDNCDTDIELVQEPLPGTEIAADQPVTVTAIDSSGNKSECTFTVEITVEDSYSFQCIGDFTVRLGEEAQNSGVIEIPTSDFIISNTSNLQFELEDQQFTCADIGTNPLTINARNTETGDTYSCIVQVTVIDVGAPMIICPAETLTRNLPEEGYEVPNFFENRISDNCNGIDELDLVQVPSAGTIIETPGSYTFNLTATDTYDNVETCEITIILEDNRQTPQYTCIPEPEIPDISLDENCSPQYPDFAGLIETENFTPEFIVTREQLTEETYLINIEIRDTATGEFVGDCSFSASVVDLIPPRISCPDDQRESFDPETGFEVPDYENMAGVSDNCGEVSFRQDPEAGEIIYTNTTVNLFVEDENGLEASCSFELELTETDVLNITCQIDKNVSPDDNCSFWLPDYTGTAEVNFDGAQITQTPPVGSIITENTQIQLTASLNGETDDCYFMVNLVDDETPVASCVSGFVVNLDNSGNASITPEELDNSSTDNCGIVSMSLSQKEFNRSDIGEVPVTLTVRDDAGNMDSCETTVEVVEEPSGAFQCRENIALSLDENGEARLDLQDLYTGDATDFSPEASRLNFSCSDLGEVEIQLNYTGQQTGSCIINVEVRDEIPPYIATDFLELSLDNEGVAYLKQEDVLAEDNCSDELIYRFDRSLFTCKDVGYNMVNVEVEDANGNIAEKLIELDITGEQCDTPEDNEIKFPILYPNPSDGIFTIATPEGMFIERIRVFDSRGRYIMQQDYSGNARFYRMSILAVAESVYTLQIFTNEGVTVKRVIIKR